MGHGTAGRGRTATVHTLSHSLWSLGGPACRPDEMRFCQPGFLLLLSVFLSSCPSSTLHGSSEMSGQLFCDYGDYECLFLLFVIKRIKVELDIAG